MGYYQVLLIYRLYICVYTADIFTHKFNIYKSIILARTCALNTHTHTNYVLAYIYTRVYNAYVWARMCVLKLCFCIYWTNLHKIFLLLYLKVTKFSSWKKTSDVAWNFCAPFCLPRKSRQFCLEFELLNSGNVKKADDKTVVGRFCSSHRTAEAVFF